MTNFNFTAENASAQVESKNVKSTKTKAPKKRGASPFSLVLKKARAQFGRQVDKNTETKRKCIEENINKYYADTLRFWLDFKNETKVLLDSISFHNACSNLGLVPEKCLLESRSRSRKCGRTYRFRGKETPQQCHREWSECPRRAGHDVQCSSVCGYGGTLQEANH